MKNCPFCNASPKTVFDDQPLVELVPYLIPGLGLGKSQMGARVECFQCGAIGPNFHTEKQALAAWNSAPRFDDKEDNHEYWTIAALQADKAELVEALEHMKWCQSCAESDWNNCCEGQAAVALLAKHGKGAK